MFKIKLGGGRTQEVEESMYWHTTSHIMAQAIKRLFPDAKLTIGPSIEKGFYYDFDVEKPFTEEDLSAIEEEMKKIIKEDLPIERFELPREEAIKLMEEREEPYKVELIKELPEGEVISFYKQGEFTDLCRGPHLPSTGCVKAIKLLSSSGAYWRGDEHNKMLQRIYGISFPKASELDEYLNMIEEAKKRDHRKLGKELELFFFDETAPGMAYWMPKGFKMMNVLIDFWRKEHEKRGYMEFSGPQLNSSELWNKAEANLKSVLDELCGKDNYRINEGDGAFYGPKIDIKMKDCLGREWQMGTVQVDFQLPLRFNLSYIDSNGEKKTPILVHRAIFGSFERFIGIITEHFAGAFPVWLSPVQVSILPISDNQKEYAEKVKALLEEKGIRVELDARQEKIGYKIREAQLQKVPYMLILGEKEVEANAVGVRKRKEGDIGQMPVEEFISMISKEIETKSL